MGEDPGRPHGDGRKRNVGWERMERSVVTGGGHCVGAAYLGRADDSHLVMQRLDARWDRASIMARLALALRAIDTVASHSVSAGRSRFNTSSLSLRRYLSGGSKLVFPR